MHREYIHLFAAPIDTQEDEYKLIAQCIWVNIE